MIPTNWHAIWHIFWLVFSPTLLLTLYLYISSILSDICSGILSDVLSDIYLTSILTYFLTFLLAFYLAFSLAWVQVQAPSTIRTWPSGSGPGVLSTASGACKIEIVREEAEMRIKRRKKEEGIARKESRGNSPARWGSPDFSKGATPPSPSTSPSGPPSPPPPPSSPLPAPDAVGHAWARTPYRQLRMLCTAPGPEHHIASSGWCGVRPGPNN